MSRTSKALKRLGVAGVAVATIGAGVPAFFATAASAAGPTAQLTITPASQSGASGTCIIYSVTPTDSTGAVPTDTPGQKIKLTASSTSAGEVEFCQPSPNYPLQGTKSTTVGAVRTPASNGTVADGGPGATPATAGTTAANNGTQTFGVRGLTAGGANIRAYVDSNGNDAFDAGEPTATATATFTAGGTNETDTSAGGNAAQDAVKSMTEIGPAANAAPIAAGSGASSTQFVTVQLKNASGDPVSGVTVSAQFGSGSANGAQTSPAAGAQPITCRGGSTTTDASGTTTRNAAPTTADPGSQDASPVSNNAGFVTCTYTALRAGSDTVTLFVNQTTGGTSGPDSGEPQLTVTRTTQAAPNTDPTKARNVDLTPEGPTNTASGQTRVFTATVTDSAGKRVQGVTVCFSKTGGGTIPGTCPVSNSFGQATQTLSTTAGETSQAVVTADITGGNECANAAGVPAGTTTAGNCTDSEVTNIGPASPSPSPSATATATASPGACTAGQQNLPVRVNTPIINATGLASVTVTGGTANGQIELQGYSQNHYGTANFNNDPTPIDRTVTAGSDGSATISDLRPASNTRIRARVKGCAFGTNALGSVINVRTQLTLAAKRTALRTIVISGGSIPARPGGLIVGLYRDGVLIPGGQARASQTSGQYSITLKFPASDQGKRINLNARTGQDAQNAPGQSNTRSLLIT